MEISPVLLIARQKCPLGMFEIFCGMSEYLFIYLFHNFLWNSSWKTLI